MEVQRYLARERLEIQFRQFQTVLNLPIQNILIYLRRIKTLKSKTVKQKHIPELSKTWLILEDNCNLCDFHSELFPFHLADGEFIGQANEKGWRCYVSNSQSFRSHDKAQSLHKTI